MFFSYFEVDAYLAPITNIGMFLFVSLSYKFWQESRNRFVKWENQGTEKLSNFPRTLLEVTCVPVQTSAAELAVLLEDPPPL